MCCFSHTIQARSFKLILLLDPGGEIPDAKTIHFIRKQRQMARDSEDFIALDQDETSGDKASSTSRLVRYVLWLSSVGLVIHRRLECFEGV